MVDPAGASLYGERGALRGLFTAEAVLRIKHRKMVLATTVAAACAAVIGLLITARGLLLEEWLLYRLCSGGPSARLEAAVRLGELRSARAVPLLLELLDEEDGVDERSRESKRPSYRGSLLAIGEAAIPHLARSLRNGDERVKARAAEFLGVLAALQVEAALPREDGFDRAETLENYHDGRIELEQVPSSVTLAIDALVASLGTGDEQVGDAAKQALAAIGGVAVPALLASLKSSGETGLVGALRALSGIAPPDQEVLDALRATERSQAAEVRLAELAVLERLAEGAHDRLFTDVLEEGELPEAGFIASRSSSPRPAVEPLCDLLKEVERRIVPRLAASDPRIRRQAVLALKGLLELGDPAIQGLVACFNDPEGEIRQTAIEVLVSKQLWEAAPALALALRHGEPLVRYGAARALGTMAGGRNWVATWMGSSAYPALRGKICDEDEQVRRAVADSLGMVVKYGQLPVEGVVDLLRDADACARLGGAQALALCGERAGPEAAPLLLQALKDREAAVRAPAALALGVVPVAPGAVVPALIEALGDKTTPDITRAAATVLAELGVAGAPAAPALVNVVRGKNAEDQRAALKALWAQRSASVSHQVAALGHAIRDPARAVRDAAAPMLRELGLQARELVPALLQALQTPDQDVARSLVGSLAYVGWADGATVLPVLLELLRGESERKATESLVEAIVITTSVLAANDTSLVPLLAKALGEERIAGPVVAILGRTGSAAGAALPDLEAIARGRDAAFQAAVAGAIRAIRGSEK